MSDTENKKTATERLEDLEKTLLQVIQHIQPLEQMAKDTMGLKEALKLLNNKLEAVITCVNNSEPITDTTLTKLMVDNNVKELVGKVATMVTQGVLKASDTVTKDSFVVLNESDKSGTVVNPRMQFLVSALNNEEVRTKLEGAKVGTTLAIGEGSVTVLESYDVVTPEAPQAALADTAATDANAGSAETPAAPAVETTTEQPAATA